MLNTRDAMRKISALWRADATQASRNQRTAMQKK
jgi:hypothetical protein